MEADYHYAPKPYGNLVSEHRDPDGPGYDYGYGGGYGYGMYGGGETLWHHYDALGSTAALTDPTQIITDTSRYTAFGDPFAETGTSPTPGQSHVQMA